MKKQEKILANINQDKDLMKRINSNTYYSVDMFRKDADRYIKAIKEGRMICSIGSVSSSGMSRTIKFLECTKNATTKRYHYYQFYALFNALDFSPDKSSRDYFRIHGCGMDMIFHTNYTIIHRLSRLGFINDKECRSLAQDTPTVI